MNWNIDMNGTLLLSFILAISSFILAIVNPEALKLFAQTLPYITGLALGRAAAGAVSKKIIEKAKKK